MYLIPQRVFLFLLVALTFDGRVPSKTQHDMDTVVNKDHELFTNQYFVVADMIRPDYLQEQFSHYALSKLEFSDLKFSKHYWYFKYLLILSGDINLHAGPVQYSCSVCAKQIRKDLSRVKNVVCGFTKNVINSRNPALALYSYVDPAKTNQMII